jgi:hypothetical protein
LLSDARLDRDCRYSVCDEIVQLAGDPRSLRHERLAHAQLALLLQSAARGPLRAGFLGLTADQHARRQHAREEEDAQDHRRDPNMAARLRDPHAGEDAHHRDRRARCREPQIACVPALRPHDDDADLKRRDVRVGAPAHHRPQRRAHAEQDRRTKRVALAYEQRQEHRHQQGKTDRHRHTVLSEQLLEDTPHSERTEQQPLTSPRRNTNSPGESDLDGHVARA